MHAFSTRPLIRQARSSDRHSLRSFLAMAEWRHEHLDWMEPADLLPQAPFLLALDHGRMAACLACPPDQEEVAWLRLFAVAPGYTPSNLWHGLWPKARQALEERGVRSIAVLTLAPWLPPLLEASGFRAQSAVIFLRWQGKPPQPVETEGLTIRTMRMEDLEKVTAVDRRAFDATWRYTTSILRAAFRKAHLASVAEHQGQIIGYQMTTASAFGAHLARLAVDPSWQARGIGSALVAHVLNHISRWGFTQLTVNTQEDNQASLRLYARMGFKRTQERFPIYQYAI